MIFPSYIFLLVFLPLVLLCWYSIRGFRLRLLILTFASYLFYAWWDYRFIVLMFASSLLDYVCGARIHRSVDQRVRRSWLIASLGGNLGLLGFFKYFDFFVDSAARGLDLLGLAISTPTLEIVLPVGISFYTFQSMSYSIDIYRGQCQPTKGFLRFAAYVSMFPQLVAGPIVRYRDMETQLEELPHKRVSMDEIAAGTWLFVIGLVKKIWVADYLAPVADHAFQFPDEMQFFGAWIGVLAYTLQLYFDFSAYSDMARGLGKMLGFQFPVNFNSPYKSASIAEFWSRWHISLSSWLRDYLFIPLGGSRVGSVLTIRNLFITMFLGGLWHGAAWNFVVWGLYHGTLLGLHATWRRLGIAVPRAAGVILTFCAVVFGWALFRADTLGEAGALVASMTGLNGMESFSHQWGPGIYVPDVMSWVHGRRFVFLIGALAVAFFAPNSEDMRKPRSLFWAIALGGVVLATLTQLGKESPFLYFQF